MLYNPPIGGAVNDPYVDANPGLGIDGSPVPAAAIEYPQRELLAVIQAAGLTPSNATLNQLLLALRAAGVFTTPAQFDNTTKAATTAHVRRALGNYVFLPLNTNTTLTAADAGTCYDWYGTTNGVVTLPLVSALIAGAAFRFQNISAYTLTVQSQGGNEFYQGGTNVASIVLGPGDCLEVCHDGVRWICIGGSGGLKGASVFGAALAANGYQKLPSGLIIQWGQTGAIPSGSQVTITLPISMPSALQRVFALCETSTSDTTPISGGWSLVSTSQFILRNKSSAAAIFSWMAIGY